MSSRLRPPPVPTPEVACRCCGKPLDAAWQPGFGDLPGHWICTCDNVAACDMAKFTIGLRDYPTKDLRAYIETGRKRREGIANA